MSLLRLTTFGGLALALDGRPLDRLRSRKTEALLLYLAARGPPPREVLAELLWPNRSQAQSAANLRVALSDLRKYLGTGLAADRDRVALDPAQTVGLDLVEFERALEAGQPETALALYTGEFLAGFSVAGAAEFEQWVTTVRERAHQQAQAALGKLSETASRHGHADLALAYARGKVALDPLDEAARLRVMRLLAGSGQRALALAEYESASLVLRAELGVEPGAELQALWHAILDGQPVGPDAALPGPGNSLTEESTAAEAPALCLGREAELARLMLCLEAAGQGHGQVLFVAGEAGSGKTTLVERFAWQALRARAGWAVVPGHCSDYGGQGDVLAPFAEILGVLAGDRPPEWSDGGLNRLTRSRLARAVTLGATLIRDDFAELRRAFAIGNSRAADSLAGETEPFVRSDRLFQHYTHWLRRLADQHPLVVGLEDLHWADTTSLSLLFHLGRRLAGSRILVVGTYRPEALAAWAGGPAQHPLGPVLAELTRVSGQVPLDLDRPSAEWRRAFVAALLAALPAQVSDDFETQLWERTSGQPLFTTELLTLLQATGGLAREGDGPWVEGARVDWVAIPARTEAVLERRLAGLTAEQRRILETASVVGDPFAADVVARALDLELEAVARGLSGALEQELRLVVELAGPATSPLAPPHYSFRHAAYRDHLYRHLARFERARLHERVGNAIEASGVALPGEPMPQAPVLAHHFLEAGLAARALPYLIQAGQGAWLLGALQEALAWFAQAEAALAQLAAGPDRDRLELTLQLNAYTSWQALKGYVAPEVQARGDRIRTLAARFEDRAALLPALQAMRLGYAPTPERSARRRFAEDLLAGVEAVDPLLVDVAHWVLGTEMTYAGELIGAREHLEWVIAHYDSRANRWLAPLFGHDVGVASRARLAWVLWLLGYPDQALAHSRAALALARDLEQPLTLSFAIGIAGVLFHQLRAELLELIHWHRASLELSARRGLTLVSDSERLMGGWIKVETGDVTAGLAEMRQVFEESPVIGTGRHRPQYLALLAVAYERAGEREQALVTLRAAQAEVEQGEERYYAPELQRLEGEWMIGVDGAAAEACFARARDMAQRMAARAWELRTVVSLARWRASQGRLEDARVLLNGIFRTFDEGLDTPDLQQARQLMTALELAG